jgi:hypothetical protein
MPFFWSCKFHVDPIMIRLIAIIMADFVANVPEIVVPRFEPNFFAQTIEKYRISVRDPEC